MRQATGRMLGIVGLAALLAGAPAGDTGALPDDLKLVSGKAGGFASARVADLLKSDTGKTLLQKMAKMEPKTDIEKEMTRELGIGPSQIERLTVVLSAAVRTEPVIIFRTTKPINREKMFANLRNPPEKKQHQGKTYYTSKFGGTYYFVNDRVFVASSEQPVKAWLEEEPAKIDAGAYRPALLQAAKGAPVVAVLDRSLLSQAIEPLPKELSGPLAEAKTALLTVISDKETQIDLRLTFADAKTAGVAVGVLKGTIGFSRQQIPLLRAELNRGNEVQVPLPEAAKWAIAQADQVIQQTDKALGDAKVSAEGMTVTARARSQTGSGQWILVVGVGGFGVRSEVRAIAPPAQDEKKKEK